MEVLDGTAIFWLIAIGMVAGGITQVCLWNQGVKFITNVITGIVAAVVVGSICILMNFSAGLMFGFLGSLGILFITNVFHLQPEASH